MSTLDPKMSDQISYERPVGAAPSILDAVVGTLTDLGSSFVNAQSGKDGPSALDQKQAALRTLSRKINEIDSMDLDEGKKGRLSTRAYKDFVAEFPAYTSDAKTVMGEGFGFEPNAGDVGKATDDGFNKWLTTNKGQAAATSIMTGWDGEGQMPQDKLAQRLNQAYLAETALQAQIEGLADSEATDKIKWRELAPTFSTRIQNEATNLAVWASKNPDALKEPELVLTQLNTQIQVQSEYIRQQAIAAGISPGHVNTVIEESMAPLANLKAMYESNMTAPGKMLEATEKANKLGVLRDLIETVGPIMADEKAREIFYQGFLSDQITGENGALFLKHVQDQQSAGNYEPFNLSMPLTPSVASAAAGTEGVVNPDKIIEFKDRAAKDPQFIPQVISTAVSNISKSDVATPSGRNTALLGLQHLVLASEAYEGPIGADTLNMIFTPQGIENIKALGDEGKALTARMMIKQVKNMRQLATSGDMLRNGDIAYENGVFVAKEKLRGFGEWGPARADSDIARAVRAVNVMMGVANRIPGVGKEVTNTVNWLFRGVEPTPEQVSQDDIEWGDLENVQLTSSSAPNPLVALIDRTEGGGDYDTLFGYSNRGGREFGSVRVSEMTIGQVLEFSNPSGEYGQWVKAELGRIGQQARVATPMGRYQFVGTTLRQVANEMGLPPDTKFNAKTQDAMFDYLARSVVQGKSDMAAAQALRGTWEGFRSVSDRELMAAVRSFKGLPPADYANLDRGVGGMTQGPSAPTGTTGGNGFASWQTKDLNLRGTPDNNGRQFNPGAGDGSRGVIDTQGSQTAAITAEEARRQAVAILQGAGMPENIIEEILNAKQGAS